MQINHTDLPCRLQVIAKVMGLNSTETWVHIFEMTSVSNASHNFAFVSHNSLICRTISERRPQMVTPWSYCQTLRPFFRGFGLWNRACSKQLHVHVIKIVFIRVVFKTTNQNRTHWDLFYPTEKDQPEEFLKTKQKKRKTVSSATINSTMFFSRPASQAWYWLPYATKIICRSKINYWSLGSIGEEAGGV